jgi:hypothetical protein
VNTQTGWPSTCDGYPRLTRLAAGLRGQLGRLHHGGAQPAYDV